MEEIETSDSRSARGLVFFPTKASLSKCLTAAQTDYCIDADGYFSPGQYNEDDTEEADRLSQLVKNWLAGDIKTLFCTSAFGQGVDWSAVRTVIIVGQPWNLLDLAQQVGRAGRDGKLSNIYLLPLEQPRKSGVSNNLQDNLVIDEDLFHQLNEIFDTKDTQTCIRHRFSKHLDEVAEDVGCLLNSDANTAVCSVCRTILDQQNSSVEEQLSRLLTSEANQVLSPPRLPSPLP